MQLLAPITRAWSQKLEGRPLRARMRLLPIGMAIALAAIFAVSVTLGVFDPRSITKVQRDYYPALRASRDMRESLAHLQNGLQNAVATRDADRLAEADWEIVEPDARLLTDGQPELGDPAAYSRTARAVDGPDEEG